MSGFKVNFSVNNQLATPSIHAAALANRPAAGQVGRLFVDTDNPSTGMYRDTGTAWVQIAQATFTDTDTLQTVTDRGNNTTNSVSIGTASAPSATLDVHGSGVIAILQGTGTNDSFLQFNKSGNGKFKVGNVHNAGNDYFTVYNLQENSHAILVNISTNNVAIGGGTVTPTYKLDITGSLRNTGNAYFGTNGSAVGIATTTPQANTLLTVQSTANTNQESLCLRGPSTDTNRGGGFFMVGNDGSSHKYGFYSDSLGLTAYTPNSNYILNFSSSTAGGSIRANTSTLFMRGTVDLSLGSNNTDNRLVIKSNGNVLIGTTTDAGYKFDCNGSLRVNNGGTYPITLNTSTSGSIAISFRLNNSEYGYIDCNTAFTNFNIFTTMSTMRFYTNSLERMTLNAGSLGIGTNSPNANALLDITSITKGVKFPSMTTAQKSAIANTAGLVVFDTTLAKLCVNSGAGWETITSV